MHGDVPVTDKRHAFRAFFFFFFFYIIQAIQNLSEETWSRADENLIELCFVAFLSNKSKKCFILVSVYRNYRDIEFALRSMDVLVTHAQI